MLAGTYCWVSGEGGGGREGVVKVGWGRGEVHVPSKRRRKGKKTQKTEINDN